MSKMIIMVPTTNSIVVSPREDKSRPKKGVPFAFTAEELEDIQRLTPNAVRKPISEATSVADESDEEGNAAEQVAERAEEDDADEGEAAPKAKPKAGAKPSKDDLGGL